MVDRARRLLNNLMGNNRNVENYDDVCIYMMAGACPFEMLKNTKLSLGECKYSNHINVKILDINKKEYQIELLKILEDFFTNKIKINFSKNPTDNIILEKEKKIELTLRDFKSTINNKNICEMYKKFENIENEIFELEKYKESFFINNKNLKMDVCSICGMNIIKNFCSKKYISHINGRAHKSVLFLRKLYDELNQSIKTK